MKKLKNKRNLTIATILLMLTFLVGAAFAATPGALQTVGVIGFGEILRVEWTDADPVVNNAVAAVNEAEIVAGANISTIASQPNQPAMGPFTANHRINWYLGLIDDGIVVLEATAENTGTIEASVSRPTGAAVGALAWFDDDPAFMDLFTVTVSDPTHSVNGASTWPVTLEPGESFDVTITLEMDGIAPLLPLIMPLSWPPVTGAGNVFDTGEVLDGFEWLNSFVFSLPYVAN